MKQFLVSCLFIIMNIATVAQQSAAVAVQLTYSEQMDTTTTLNVKNYTIVSDKGKFLNVLDVKKHKTNDSVFVLITEPPLDKTWYFIYVNNVKDRAGNLIDTTHNSANYLVKFYNKNTPKPIINKLGENQIQLKEATIFLDE